MYKEEILSEIDATLEQLIKNAQTLHGSEISDLSEPEIDAFQKTQESLLHHLVRLDLAYQTKRKTIAIPSKKSAASKIQEKYYRYEKLKTTVNQTLEKAEKNLPIFSKRRNKRFLAGVYRIGDGR